MSSNPEQPRKSTPIWRAIVEIGLLIFLLYSNLLMREFTHANGQEKSLTFAIQDIFTVTNFVIAVISGLIGCFVFEYLRKQISSHRDSPDPVEGPNRVC
jgi:hypothetical protein